MEIIRQNKDGEELCYIKCEEHNFYFKGMPPMTTGCKECWKTYFFGLHCLSKDKAEMELFEEGLHHALEEIDKGNFDFKPFKTPKITIEKEN